jgi:DNA-binding XRE family transcriptional regulator
MAPSSRGLGHHPLKVETRIRIPLGLQSGVPGQGRFLTGPDCFSSLSRTRFTACLQHRDSSTASRRRPFSSPTRPRELMRPRLLARGFHVGGSVWNAATNVEPSDQGLRPRPAGPTALILRHPSSPSGDMIRARRIELGWSQSELAEATGVTQADISRIENGHLDARWSTIQRISAILAKPHAAKRSLANGGSRNAPPKTSTTKTWAPTGSTLAIKQ